jgi:hypothetical protein
LLPTAGFYVKSEPSAPAKRYGENEQVMSGKLRIFISSVQTHASQPNNPLIAEPLFLTKYIEKAGTGTVDMLDRCRAAGMKQPEFCTDAGFFILTVWRKIPATQSGHPAVLLGCNGSWLRMPKT